MSDIIDVAHEAVRWVLPAPAETSGQRWQKFDVLEFYVHEKALEAATSTIEWRSLTCPVGWTVTHLSLLWIILARLFLRMARVAGRANAPRSESLH